MMMINFLLLLGGDVKPLYFLNSLLSDGYLSEYRSKLLYLQLQSLPQDFIKDGWLAEAFLRNYLSANAINLIKGTQGHSTLILENFKPAEVSNIIA